MFHNIPYANRGIVCGQGLAPRNGGSPALPRPLSSRRAGASPNCHIILVSSRAANGSDFSLMQIAVQDDVGATAKVVLTGKLDIAGAEVVALPLATLSGA